MARCRSAYQFAACLLLPLGMSACALADQYRWTDVDRIVAVSDPHGAYDALVETLENASVIDDTLAWSGGTTHLVITGDLMDRGADSRKIMDLVMRLESESQEQGGMVHLTLGNHEVMNLVGDLRYVARGEYAAFADDETAEERERWFQQYRAAKSIESMASADDASLRAEFDKTRPPGFFAHRAAFSSEGKYGRWLLTKPLLVVVNDTAFVHGGLPPLIAELGLDGLNDELRAEVVDYVRQLEVLIQAGLIDPAASFYEHDDAAGTLAADTTLSPPIKSALQSVMELNEARVHDAIGPLWYRGTVGCSVLAEGDVLSESLAAIGAERVVIGHTPTVTRRVLQKFDGQVIEIDTGMLSSAYQGSGNALVIEGGQLSVVNESDSSNGAPVPHPRRVGARDDELSAAALESLLATGNITSVHVDEAGRKMVQITAGDRTISALFAKARSKRVNTELAAYRLDQLLGLDMVPVTVAREVDGDRGSLQFLPKNVRDEAFRTAGGQGGGAWCPLSRQWNSMYVFDTLVHNEGRAPGNMNYSPSNWQLLLTGHANAFGTRRDRPRYLAEIDLELTGTWIEALGSLTDATLTENFADVLDKRRLTALGRRRDMLLSEVATVP
ncbi:MAG: metallophosphoesterase [Woeseiaceae bacterium]